MIKQLHYTKTLQPFITDRCEENNICITMAADIPGDHYLVIKVDSYYHSLKLENTPPSVDCLIPLKCRGNDFIIYLVELKNIRSPQGFDIKNVYEKFKTTVENFMGKRFKTIFCNDRYVIKRLSLYFVTTAYGKSNKALRQEGTRIDFLRSLKPIKFQGKAYQIEHRYPNPLIKNC